MKLDPLKKPPINISKPSIRIDASLYKSAIARLVGRGKINYLPRVAFKALREAGLGRGLSLGAKNSVARKDIIKAAQALEEAGIIKHQPIKEAADLSKLTGQIERWREHSAANIKKRAKEYTLEEYKKGRDNEGTAAERRVRAAKARIGQAGGVGDGQFGQENLTPGVGEDILKRVRASHQSTATEVEKQSTQNPVGKTGDMGGDNQPPKAPTLLNI